MTYVWMNRCFHLQPPVITCLGHVIISDCVSADDLQRTSVCLTQVYDKLEICSFPSKPFRKARETKRRLINHNYDRSIILSQTYWYMLCVLVDAVKGEVLPLHNWSSRERCGLTGSSDDSNTERNFGFFCCTWTLRWLVKLSVECLVCPTGVVLTKTEVSCHKHTDCDLKHAKIFQQVEMKPAAEQNTGRPQWNIIRFTEKQGDRSQMFFFPATEDRVSPLLSRWEQEVDLKDSPSLFFSVLHF